MKAFDFCEVCKLQPGVVWRFVHGKYVWCCRACARS